MDWEAKLLETVQRQVHAANPDWEVSIQHLDRLFSAKIIKRDPLEFVGTINLSNDEIATAGSDALYREMLIKDKLDALGVCRS